MTPWPEYRELKVEALARAMRGRVIIDPYRLVHGANAREAGFSYYTLGQPALVPA
jgi:UDPglucose 6-dehydrogenase